MIKNAWRRIKSDPLFASLYIFGSALSIASAMIIVIYLHVKLSDIYPERDRTSLYELGETKLARGGTSTSSSCHNLRFAEEHVAGLPGVKAVALHCQPYYSPRSFQAPSMKAPREIESFGVNFGWFDVYDFDFIEGNRFTREAYDAGERCVLLSDRLATSAFGSPQEAMGKTVQLNKVEYKVTGVFREPSRLTTFCEAMVPITCLPDALSSWSQGSVGGVAVLGSCEVTLLANEGISGEELSGQYAELIRNLNSAASESDFKIENFGLISVAAERLGIEGFFTPAEVFRKYGLLLLMLLFVPALNLSGLISGRMESRLPEMGVRKSFGARRGRLFRTVLAENLVLTGLGAIIGLGLAVAAVWSWRGWFFGISQNVFYESATDVRMTSDMMFAPLVFVSAFMVCLLLNLLASMIPVWWSLRRPIVESLSTKK